MILQLDIQDVAFGGKGVARHEGKVIFTPFCITGETVEAELMLERKSFAEARLLQVVAPSPERVPAPCPYFQACGGCTYQHIAYPEQLRIKQVQVSQALSRIGKITAPVDPCVPSPTPFAYRNRITVHADENALGFFASDAHRLVDIDRCLIASEEVNKHLADLRTRHPQEGHFTLREHTGSRTFRQTNDTVAELLANAVGDALPAMGSLLIDAYCGAGFFLKRFRDRFARLTGIEWSKFAIAQAQKKAAPHEEYLLGDVALHLADALRDQPADTTLLLDPPAEGLASGVIRSILKAPPAHLLYISCDPPTLARDLGRLSTAFEIRKVTPFDMFPQTAEIEVLAVLERKK